MIDPVVPSDLRPMPGQHLATITYQNRIWDVYLEFEGKRSTSGEPCRAKLVYSPADGESGDAAQTAAIFVEETYELAVEKARSFRRHQLEALLRSILP